MDSTTSNLLDISTLYYEPAALKYKRGQEIFDKYKHAELIEVPGHWNIDTLNQNPDLVRNWNQVKSHYLVLGVKNAIQSRPNGRSTDWIAPSHSSGCTMACSYCYVARRKGYANPITVFANIEKILAHIKRKCARLGPKVITQDNFQTDPHLWTWDIGENNDASVDDMVSPNVKDLIDLFADLPNAKASFATKYVNRNLLNYDPKGHTRVRFSLMPPHVARVVDVRTSPVAERIAAINDFVEAGYEVHINLSPVIIYPGWQLDYIQLFMQLDAELNTAAKEQLKAEIIFLTHNESLHELNLEWHPKGEEQYLWRYPEMQQRKLSQNGMVNLRYKNNIKGYAVKEIKNLIAEHLPYCVVRYAF